MTLTRLTTRAYAVGLAAVLALAGCGDPEEGTPSPTAVGTGSVASAATAAPPTSATTTAPVDPVLARIPAAARPETKEGATAYVRYYFQEVNRAFSDADSSRIQDLAAKECEMCSAFSAGVEDLRSKGHHYARDLATIQTVTPMEFTASGGRVLVDLTQMPVPIQDAHGKTVRTAPKAEVRFVATVLYHDRWIITRVQNAK